MIATSGSTGMAKGVVLTHNALAASAAITSRYLGIDPAKDRWLCCLPVAHIGGLSVITRALLTDTPLTVMGRFDAAAVMKAAQSGGVTRISLVTRALRQIDPAAFTTILLGGAAPPPNRPANVIATYGSTETGSGVVYERTALDGVELRTDDSGQLWVRSPTLLRCYRSAPTPGQERTDPEAHPSGAFEPYDPKDAAGWYPTGDAGRVDSNGVLTVSGRMADVIVTGGEKVWPGRIEPLIASLPGITGVAVVGRQDPEWGHRVVAIIELAESSAAVDQERVRAAIAEAGLPAWWVPKTYEYVARLPRTALGKIQRNLL